MNNVFGPGVQVTISDVLTTVTFQPTADAPFPITVHAPAGTHPDQVIAAMGVHFQNRLINNNQFLDVQQQLGGAQALGFQLGNVVAEPPNPLFAHQLLNLQNYYDQEFQAAQAAARMVIQRDRQDDAPPDPVLARAQQANGVMEVVKRGEMTIGYKQTHPINGSVEFKCVHLRCKRPYKTEDGLFNHNILKH